jgi:peptidyl-prolyl cis-trans isomerase D
MLSKMRGKFAQWMIGLIIVFIGFVFVFYGVYTPNSQMGGPGGGETVGSINGEAVTGIEFARIVNRYTETFKSRGFQEEQLKMLGIQNWAWDEIVNQRLLTQEGKKQGVTPSEEEVRDQIQKIPAFQRDGKFDLGLYKQLLTSNKMNTAQFEQSVRHSLLSEQWQRYFANRAVVTDAEIKQDYQLENDRRKIAFVLLTNESGKKSLTIPSTEVETFLKDSKGIEQVKSRFEGQKEFKYKGKKLEDVQSDIAREVLLENKTDAIRVANEKQADEVIAMMDGKDASKIKINTFLKTAGVKVEESAYFNRKSSFISGIGDSKDIVKDAFQTPSPLDPKNAGKAKKYSVARGVVVAVLVSSQTPDLTKLTAEELMANRKKLGQNKESELYGNWMKQLKTKAKITKNDAVFSTKGLLPKELLGGE